MTEGARPFDRLRVSGWIPVFTGMTEGDGGNDGVRSTLRQAQGERVDSRFHGNDGGGWRE